MRYKDTTIQVADPKRPVTSAWLNRYGDRLDASTFLNGSVEAEIALDRLDAAKQPLRTLTSGHDGGLYNGPMFKRVYVQDPVHGVPFMTASPMLVADLTSLSLLSKDDAHSSRLSYLELEPGMTLISCSGTIGRTVYARPDMAGVWGSQDVLKVVPDESKIPPGYLFAFLASRFGAPMVTSGTYGSIIQHLEPKHIADLPVPRLGDDIEEDVHQRVQEAAQLRVDASALFHRAIQRYEEMAGLPRLEQKSPYSRSISTASSTVLAARMDAPFSSQYHQEALDAVEQSANGAQPLARYVERITEPTRFKRIKIDSEEHGVPFFGTSDLLRIDPQPSYLIPRNESSEEYIVNEATVLIPRSGQKGGLIGTAVLPYGDVIGGAVSEHAIRAVCASDVAAGYVYVALSLESSIRQLKSRAYGSSIPSLSEDHVASVLIPVLDESDVEEVGKMGAEVARLRHKAILKERQAIQDVERAIAD